MCRASHPRGSIPMLPIRPARAYGKPARLSQGISSRPIVLSVALCGLVIARNVIGMMSALKRQPTISSLATAELEYELPERLIATRPVEPRDSARMLVMSRSSDAIEHAHVRDLPGFLQAGDALVFNTTAVAPARLIGMRLATGGKVEGLFLHDVPAMNGHARWQVLLHAGGRLKSGDRIALNSRSSGAEPCVIELVDREQDQWIVQVQGAQSTAEVLEAVGLTPLPPYILKARGACALADEFDRRWYQTMYADPRKRKSVAAPTAGLHFTPELLDQLFAKGIERVDVTLHVGAGTFKPITAATLAGHRLHSEQFEVSAAAIGAINRARLRSGGSEASRGGRIIAVGTTSVRTLESLAWNDLDPSNSGNGVHGSTDLLIAPPYEFRCVNGLLTNFHLPRSTLLALVAAMVGLDRLKAVYRVAIDKGYRFYSYGDAMLIVP
jgi:S-adenosylmethionine:tRNA ribosyltransferase-isomerase